MKDNHRTASSISNAQRRALLQVLLLNAGLSVALLIGGLMADSSGLIANALDNTSDAMAYTVSYFAVTRSNRWKTFAATITGVMLFVLAAGVTVDAVRRFIVGSEPIGITMVVMALVAAAINALCITLLCKCRSSDVNMRAAWTMSINDFVSNFGIIIAGTLVSLVGSNWPDLAIALLIAAVALYGGIKTFRDANYQRKASTEAPSNKT
jgi:cobalt-zinc-cadmium efflux system protein